jgi:hypothetical protein
MKKFSPLLSIAILLLVGCNKVGGGIMVTNVAPENPKSNDALSQKLREFAGGSATDCGRLGLGTAADRSKTVSDCAMQANHNKQPFYVAYDMPGLSVGIAGNAEGKNLSVQSHGEGSSATLSSEGCPADLRIAGSGRVTCFAPGDMGSLGDGHTAIPEGMPNPHAFPKKKNQ